MKLPFPAALALAAAALAATTTVVPTTSAQSATDPVARGRYLVRIAGCNDCHTAGFAMSNGATPEKDWLAGDAVGWQGAWGTTYAPNLRIFFQSVDDKAWIAAARTREFKPPMPTPSLRAMTDDDLRAIARYVRSLGPAGAPAPAYVPPGQPVKGPVVTFPAPPK